MATKIVTFNIDQTLYDSAKIFLDTHIFDDAGQIQFATVEDFLKWRLEILAKQ